MLKEKMKAMKKMVGMYVQLSDISISRIAGLAGYDAIWVDTEHSYMSYETLLGHIMALRTTDTPILVRLPQNDLTATKKVLEMGVDGVIFPMVHNQAEARTMIDATLYPPYGNRGFGPMNAIDYGLADVKEYLQGTVENLCRFVQIEHRETLEDLDKIMENEFIDGYIFGPNDLSGSYNMLGDVFSEKITDRIRTAIAKLHEKGKYAIIASGGCSREVIAHWSGLGADMIFAGADFDFIRDGAIQNRRTLEAIHKKIGQS